MEDEGGKSSKIIKEKLGEFTDKVKDVIKSIKTIILAELSNLNLF